MPNSNSWSSVADYATSRKILTYSLCLDIVEEVVRASGTTQGLSNADINTIVYQAVAQAARAKVTP